VPSLHKEVLSVADVLPTILGRLDMAALLLTFRDITKGLAWHHSTFDCTWKLPVVPVEQVYIINRFTTTLVCS